MIVARPRNALLVVTPVIWPALTLILALTLTPTLTLTLTLALTGAKSALSCSRCLSLSALTVGSMARGLSAATSAWLGLGLGLGC